ncbi:FAD-binding protein [Novosphingobium panipatense]
MNAYDRMFGDPASTPNPNLGPIDTAPSTPCPSTTAISAPRGLRCDAQARVLDGAGNAIPGLYAAGNNAASPFGDTYPGAGATIGPAMTFGYVAANAIAERAFNQRTAPHTACAEAAI